MHKIGFFIFPGHQILDLAGPLAAFDFVPRFFRRKFYSLEVLSLEGGPVLSCAGVPVGTSCLSEAQLDTLIIVGGEIPSMLCPSNVQQVARVAETTGRVASVCTGAFLLAEMGLLDSRRATTHWRNARQLQQRYPSVKVEADRIFVADGPIWTSAGTTAGIDLALALIELDIGLDVANSISRELVVYHRRSGGQSQFSAMSSLDPASDRIRFALAFARDHLHEDLSIHRLADAVNLSVRQFGRRFQKETGITPAKAVERLRVEAARVRVEDGSEAVERIARSVGFGDPERMRRAFIRVLGAPPQAVRRDNLRRLAQR